MNLFFTNHLLQADKICSHTANTEFSEESHNKLIGLLFNRIVCYTPPKKNRQHLQLPLSILAVKQKLNEMILFRQFYIINKLS